VISPDFGGQGLSDRKLGGCFPLIVELLEDFPLPLCLFGFPTSLLLAPAVQFHEVSCACPSPPFPLPEIFQHLPPSVYEVSTAAGN